MFSLPVTDAWSSPLDSRRMTDSAGVTRPADPFAGAASPCVVHLVRAANGIEPFRAFLESYTRHPAGLRHELVLLFKGFTSERDADPYLELADGLAAQTVFVEDQGFDLTAYRTAAERINAGRLCFLNSYSRPLVDGWLSLLAAPLSRPDVGLTGTGGSYESAYSEAPFWLRLRRRRGFHPFPNPNLRTNGFMLERELMLDLDWPSPDSKAAAWAIESGKRSLSRQVWERGLEVVVVGRDGLTYERDRWRESATFRGGDQRNLLIGDNRTLQYEQADPAFRRRLEQMAWGTAEAQAHA